MHYIFLLYQKGQATPEKCGGNDEHDAKAGRVCPRVSNKNDKYISHHFCISLSVYFTVFSTSTCWK